MEQHFFLFTVSGEYALLLNTETKDTISVALALLPPGVGVGARLVCRDGQWSRELG